MNLIDEELTYKIIGCCIEVHKSLGKGFNEIVYKDALQYEFNKNKISFEREKEFQIGYKEITLPHKYFADFIVFDKIILEIKAIETITNSHIKQTLNYLAASKLKVGLIINFGEDSLKYKRVIL
ncbi:MAG: NADH:ubiquinone oxidoreductase [Stygiobacter sp. RIFOXYA12_FULL_38_9]|nr:MAG: NADH:ubiquinone oxidoreductase [Stygiobacter sp. GWC2_38_9]OGU80059.1 MAG: NADH:ubiquinone oxidoreductase [Stygiobacter sp. RIFOXYA12_FULL_38_9]OGV09272.1 MAG: NADH:ubiquinone oxidoreductase [Stygiobacter sp. RIFOXYB2_FULL_37_11]OGV14311.1 MAG: NADH:ubiquinone oxidoreductase [Stygiobacter sp. RIFOXYA2_FULL_38_8]OGV16519.1 MAG: NADH:ubiquinone oxidoreductase [Stygiobacter sp. RIFOXYC2_FULL_38_25]OGV79899.1 MAG: NADH:ubiquinone oxidoreductase [Stygiobacter sp. GWF2_38_21]